MKTVSKKQTRVRISHMGSVVGGMLDVSLLGLSNRLKTQYKVMYSTGEHFSCDLCTTFLDPLLQFGHSSGSTAEHLVLQITPEEVMTRI
jgi:hypothetical protein